LGKNGEMLQKTEDTVGPYELHDFFLYYMLRFGFSPSKIYFLAKLAFAKKEEANDELYSHETILKWLRTFYWRFFSQQFKRSCLPDGPKIGSVCLSPRGDWRMPSDACSTLWLQEVDQLEV
ncbi:MAG: NAD(+) synthase, partial [Cellulosilyticum sp.]|nr:NAD(+) synthase [Cellulosilyticum sp.]